MANPRRQPSTLRNIGILALFVAGAYFLPNLLNGVTDLLFFPWVRSRPPLLDEWLGQLTTGNGVRLVVAVALERDLTDSERICIRCNQIKGTALTCDGRSAPLRYRISGSPRDRRGRQLHFGTSPTPQPTDGLELDTLAGTWDGGDVLELHADFFWRRGVSAISSTDDPANQPVPLRMERRPIAAFESMCAALR